MNLSDVELSSVNESNSVTSVTIPLKNKISRREYNVSNRSCEIVVNGLKEVTRKYEKMCKSVIKVLKANPRTKFKTHFCVTAMPEFMERVHSLDFSNRVIFLDGSGNANRFNCSVFVLLIDSHVGALPLGFFITSYKSASLLEPTFNALCEIMPNNAFNISALPKVVLTGSDQAEYAAITKCFPSVKAYIGIFRLLRDVWRYIWDSNHGVAFADRSLLYQLFKSIIHSQSEEQFFKNIQICNEHSTSKKYPEFLKYLSILLKKKDLWALDFRVRNSICYNKDIFTSERHVLKENILHSSRTYSVTELFEFFCTTYCEYYRKKIIDATFGIIKSLSDLRYMTGNKNELVDLEVGMRFDEEILVLNSKRNSEYYVNIELGTCTCVLGKHGTSCIHQYTVAAKIKSHLFTIAPMTSDEKSKYNYLADGLSNEVEVEGSTSYSDNYCVEESINDVDSMTEYVVVSHLDNECDLKAESQVQYTSEDCINTMEIFWSKLCPYTKDHPNEIHRWISMMNHKLDATKSFSDVLSVLYSKTNS